MGYAASNAFKRLIKNKSVYSLYFIQISVAFCLLVLISSLNYTIRKTLDEHSNESTWTMFFFRPASFRNAGGSPSDFRSRAPDRSFTFEEYEYIKERYSDVLHVCLAGYRNFGTGFATLLEDGTFDEPTISRTYHIFNATDEFLRFVYPMENPPPLNSEQYIYAGGDFITDLYDHFEIFGRINYRNLENVDVYNNTITLTEGGVFTVLHIDVLTGGAEGSIYYSGSPSLRGQSVETRDINDCIIAPYGFKLSLIPNSFSGILSIAFKDDVADGAVIREILDYLQAFSGSELGYTFSSLMQANFGTVNLLKNIADTYGTILWPCVVIMIIGFIGLMAIIIDNRKRNIAVSIICGATSKRIMTELFIEVQAIILLSGLTGIAASFLLRDMASRYMGMEITINYQFMLVSLMTAFLSGIVIMLIPAAKINKLDILQVLGKTN
jgi:uncharacterized membrane protein YiaA